MEYLGEYLSRSYVPLIANIGLLALLAWVVSLFGRFVFVEKQDPWRLPAIGVGVLFGVATAMLMLLPIELEPGIFGDARGAPILLSGIVGGPIAAAVATLIGVATRLQIGGPGAVVGSLFMTAFAVAGVVWQQYTARQHRSGVSIRELVILATVTTALTAPLVLLNPPAKQLYILTNLWPQLFVANVLGVIILGTFIRREYMRRLAEVEIAKERARAEQEAAARKRFLNAMSHEMRTPLNGLLGILQLVLRKQMSTELRRDLGIAMDSGLHLLTLINQVLDMAKLDAGRPIVTKQNFTVEALFDNLYSIFKYQADGKGLHLKLHIIGDGEKELSGDFEHIRQVLFNLTGNAIKFTAAGGVDLVAHIDEVRGRYRLRIEVRDTGPGIPEDETALIFEEFHQTDVGENRSDSSGLGLSISRQLADVLDAELRVESEVGVGTSFFFEIHVDEAENLTKSPDKEVDAGPLDRSVHVLVAEDNALNQMVVRGMLEEDGHRVTMADNGRIAVDYMERTAADFDLILMDVQMPEMDGIEATRAIRTLDHVDKTFPIVALTANAFTDQHEAFLDAGMDGVLTKPLSLDALRQKLAEFVNVFAAPRDVPDTVPVDKEARNTTDDDCASMKTDVIDMLHDQLGQENLDKLLEQFQAKSDMLIEEMANTETTEERRAACSHELRGMASNFGFDRAVELLHEIEYDDLPEETVAEKIDETDGILKKAVTMTRERTRQSEQKKLAPRN